MVLVYICLNLALPQPFDHLCEMDSSSVAYDNTDSKVTSSYSNLVGKRNGNAMQTRLIYGTIVVLLVAVLALVIALAVVASNKSDGTSGGAETGSDSQGQTGGNTDDSWDLPVVDCSYAATNLDKAKCVLDSYPLVDG